VPGEWEGRHRFSARVVESPTSSELARELSRTASDPEGVGIMTQKGRIYAVRLDRVSLRAAPLLKQEALAVGADSAHARGIADHSVTETSVVLLATWAQYRRLIEKLERQPFQLRALGAEVEAALRAYVRHGPRTVPGAHRSLVVGDRPRVMGVVNVTPDSFSDGGEFLDPERAIAHGRVLIDEGADLLDIGGESTRPGATSVDPEEEWRRIAPVVHALAQEQRVPISVDTRHVSVAERALEAGADMINDVSGLADPEMRRVVREGKAAAIVMHMRGEPATMQNDTRYADLRGEVFSTLAARTDAALRDGISADRLLTDPGLGFGKTPEQSLELLAHSGELRSLGYPVVLGASRKSMLGWALGSVGYASRLEAGIAAAVIAAMRGVEVIRTHDVAPTVRALAVVARVAEAAHARPEPPGY
jgi:dihydropteroate synthase